MVEKSPALGIYDGVVQVTTGEIAVSAVISSVDFNVSSQKASIGRKEDLTWPQEVHELSMLIRKVYSGVTDNDVITMDGMTALFEAVEDSLQERGRTYVDRNAFIADILNLFATSFRINSKKPERPLLKSSNQKRIIYQRLQDETGADLLTPREVRVLIKKYGLDGEDGSSKRAMESEHMVPNGQIIGDARSKVIKFLTPNYVLKKHFI